MKRTHTPVPSQVSSVTREIERIAKGISKDYREVLDDIRTPSMGSWAPRVSGSAHVAADGSQPGPTANTVVNNEHRLRALGEGYQRVEDALASLRSAHGLIARAMDASKHESKGSNYTAKEMEEMEARARDKNPRGMKGGRVAVRSIR